MPPNPNRFTVHREGRRIRLGGAPFLHSRTLLHSQRNLHIHELYKEPSLPCGAPDGFAQNCFGLCVLWLAEPSLISYIKPSLSSSSTSEFKSVMGLQDQDG